MKTFRFLLSALLTGILVPITVDAAPAKPTPACSCDRMQDSLALVQLFQALDGPHWMNSWDLAQPMQSWLGVTLSPTGCVENLSVVDRLRGNVPDIALPNLKTLQLAATWPKDSTYVSTLPDFSGLPNLEELQIMQLVNAVPNTSIPDFSHLPKLKALTFSGNFFSGPLTNFSHLPQLKTLIFAFNFSTGNLLDYNFLPALEKLSIRESLTGTIPDFQNLHALKELDLGGSKALGFVSLAAYTGQIPDFTKLPKLERLALSYLGQTTMVPNFSHLPQLRYLELTGRHLYGAIPNFDLLPLLQTLEIGGYRAWFLLFPEQPYPTQISGPIPDFSGLMELEELDLSLNLLDGALPNFSHLPKIKHLNASNNHLSGTIPPFEHLPPTAQSIDLSVNRFDSCSLLNTSAQTKVVLNILTFESLLPNLAKFSNYAPQDSIPVSPGYFTNGNGNQEIDLHIDENVIGSTYRWYKNSVLIGTTTNNNLELPGGSTPADIFYVLITNPQAPALTLVTQKFRLSSTPPEAAFSWLVFQQSCNSTLLQFASTSTNGFSLLWNFPGGTPSSSTQAMSGLVNYTQPGIYPITLIATNNAGVDTFTQLVTVPVYTFPSGDFSVVTDGTVVTCTATDSNATSYFWNFGDLSFSNTGPVTTHTYSNNSPHTITLTVSNPCGFATSMQNVSTVPPEAAFTWSISQQACNSTAVQFVNTSTNSFSVLWTFPGGTPASSTLASPGLVHYNQPGVYPITLIVTNNLGTDTFSQMITVPVQMFPNADFSIVTNGSTVTCTAAQTNAPSYSWSFGDQSTSNAGPTVMHTYSGSNTYSITLTVTSICGSATSIQTVGITPTEEVGHALSIKVYPNPADDQFTVEIDAADSGEVQCYLCNSAGQTVLRASRTEPGKQLRYRFETAGLPAGVYTLKVGTAGQWMVRKVVVD